MNERLSLQDLIDFLARKQGITKKESETFLREFFSIISATIEKNEPVKIKDFGTFKLVKVNSRRSVDVNTGEAIEIPAHYKLSFTPDKLLKEAINRPFANFESVVLEEGVSFDNIDQISDQIQESLDDIDLTEEDTIAEISEAVTPPIKQEEESVTVQQQDVEEPQEPESIAIESPEEEREEEAVSAVEQAEEEAIIEPETPAEDVIETVSSVKEDKTEVSEEMPVGSTYMAVDTEENIQTNAGFVLAEEEQVLTSTDNIDSAFENHRKRARRRRYISLGFIIFLIIAGFAVGGYYFQEVAKFITGEQTTGSDKDKQVVVVLDKIAPADSLIQNHEPIPIADVPLATETIKEGDTLGALAKKYYGKNTFWVYIYEENKGTITNPNNVDLGAVLVIPAPEKYGIDPDDPASVEIAKKKESKLFAEFYF
ncbi:HU family DNA-binding protein [Prevotella sp. 10(H)]|uniref:HU family DNA-binding protein n=1 Tax=Prevotella sp. 10(H) TaxID=1158294 RepID=UPI0004A773D4|nr:HU family DNA-binding protein [Prevotella sp. 10(H)]